MLGLGQVIRSLGPDVVHVHYEPWAMTTLRAIATGVPVVIHAAESLLREAPLALRLRRTGTRHALRSCAGYINWGVTGLAAASEAGLPATTPRAILPAAPPNPEVFTRQPLRQPDGTLRVVYVGRLAPEKGVETLLRASADPQRRHLLQVTIVGEGSLMKDLREKAETLGAPAEFCGVLDPAATHEAIASADVLVAPSQDTAVVSEQWGRSVVEAMMTGRSVLTSDAGELPYLVEDRTWTFPQGDWAALGRALDTLIADPSLVATRAEEAYARSVQHRPTVVAERIYDFWGEALAASTDRSASTGRSRGSAEAHEGR
jgi:glycosyltransferase involved in cell wall biosynthesis